MDCGFLTIFVTVQTAVSRENRNRDLTEHDFLRSPYKNASA